MQDRRVSPRRKEALQARIFFNNRKSGFGCVLKDFSTTGARIGVSEKDRVPDEFELYVPEKQKAFPARVRWRHENELGLTFISALGSGNQPPFAIDLQKRVERLESEIATLTEQVRNLTAKAT